MITPPQILFSILLKNIRKVLFLLIDQGSTFMYNI